MNKFIKFLKDYRRYCITALLVLGLIISAVLEKDLITKHYVTLSFALAIALYWFVETIIMYVAFRKTYPEEYKLYIAQTVNNKNISADEILADNKRYYKKFKRTMLKDSFINFSYILITIGLMVAFIVAMVI